MQLSIQQEEARQELLRLFRLCYTNPPTLHFILKQNERKINTARFFVFVCTDLQVEPQLVPISNLLNNVTGTKFTGKRSSITIVYGRWQLREAIAHYLKLVSALLYDDVDRVLTFEDNY